MTFENAVELRNVTKRFDGFSLENVTFDLPRGCILGLIGENGAGKSTTLRLIMNGLKADEGTIHVLGADNRSEEFEALKEDIGVVLDEACFPAVLTVKEVNRVLKNTYKNWREETFFFYTEQFQLPQKRMFKEFSRGMKMKLAIAAALSHKPRLLILDEATSGLDPVVRDEILDIFYDFTRDPQHSILISSHILSDLEKLCDYIAFLHEGKLLFCREKDLLTEEYAMIRCPLSQLKDLPNEAVCGMKKSSYGAEILVRKALINPAFETEKASIEDIMLYMTKGESMK